MHFMKILTPAAVKSEIKRRNRLFKKASAAQKRVLIAKDVLTQLKLRRIKAKTGRYINLSYEVESKFYGEEFQPLFLQRKIPRCTACALGAIMISCTAFNNNQKVGDPALGCNLGQMIKDGDLISNGSTDIFTLEQLSLIEQAFEQGAGEFFGAAPKTVEFGRGYRTDSSRLKAIMENIIRNKGTFIP